MTENEMWKVKWDRECKFNVGIMCRTFDIAHGMCKSCGWNPDVAADRKWKLRQDPIAAEALAKAREKLKEGRS